MADRQRQAVDEMHRQFTEAVTDPAFWQDVAENACGRWKGETEHGCGRMLAGTVQVTRAEMELEPERLTELLALKVKNMRWRLSTHLPAGCWELVTDWQVSVPEPQVIPPHLVEGEEGVWLFPVLFQAKDQDAL